MKDEEEIMKDYGLKEGMGFDFDDLQFSELIKRECKLSKLIKISLTYMEKLNQDPHLFIQVYKEEGLIPSEEFTKQEILNVLDMAKKKIENYKGE